MHIQWYITQPLKEQRTDTSCCNMDEPQITLSEEARSKMSHTV